MGRAPMSTSACSGPLAEMAPQDREILASWAQEITGPVIDAGCGPGHWTAFLHERGIAVGEA